MRSCDDSEVRFKSFFAKLNKTELIDLVEICLKGQDDNIFKKQNYWSFVRNAIVLLHHKGKIAINEMGNIWTDWASLHSSLQLCKENCRSVEIGWYCKGDITDRIGMVQLLINGKKKLAVDYVIERDPPAKQFKFIITKGRVTIGNYNESGSLFKSIMAKLNRRDLLEFCGILYVLCGQ